MRAAIRFATEKDAGELLKIYTPYILSTPITFEYTVPDLEEFKGRIARITEDLPWIVCEDGGRILGYAYASHFHDRAAYAWDAELSIYIRDGQFHQGVGRALYTTLISLMSRLGYYNLYAVITVPNKKSVGIHRYFGFTEEGVLQHAGYKLGKWHDVAYLVKRLRPYDEPKAVLKVGDLDTVATQALFLTGEEMVHLDGKEHPAG